MKMEKPILPKRIFWDVDFEKIDYDEKKRFVIERVFDRGDLPDITQVRRYYGDETIIEILTTAKYLFEETTIFCARYFDVPIENFRCYREKQLNLQPSFY
jgi:hypothetical protein